MTPNHKVGTDLQCIKSESLAYKKGSIYTVIDENGIKGLRGEDGLFDPLSLLVSVFKPAKAMDAAISKLKVVK